MAGSKTEVIVLDASVAVKWFNQEEYSDQSLLMLDDYRTQKLDLVAPYLLIFEVANALRYNTEFGETDVLESMAYLRQLQIDLELVDASFTENAVSVAFTFGLTVYDSFYVALAQRRDCDMYTSDEKLLTKMSENKRIHHISQYRKK